MNLLSVIGDVLAPVFLLCLVGWVAGRRLDLDPRPVARVAYFVFAPAFVFSVLLDAEIAAGEAAQLVGTMVATVVIVTGLALLFGRWLGASPTIVAALAVAVSFPNVGNFGFPILDFRFGSAATDLAAVSFLASVVFSFAVAVLAATWGRGRVIDAVWAALTSPVVVIAPVALGFRFAGLSLPLAVDRGVGLLAQGMVPAMLVSLGLQLAASGRPALDHRGALAAAVGLRLVVAPVVALVVGALAGLDGLGLDVAVIQSAMPSAVFCALIAIEHDQEPAFVTGAVVVSTLASVGTLALVLAAV